MAARPSAWHILATCSRSVHARLAIRRASKNDTGSERHVRSRHFLRGAPSTNTTHFPGDDIRARITASKKRSSRSLSTCEDCRRRECVRRRHRKGRVGGAPLGSATSMAYGPRIRTSPLDISAACGSGRCTAPAGNSTGWSCSSRWTHSRCPRTPVAVAARRPVHAAARLFVARRRSRLRELLLPRRTRLLRHRIGHERKTSEIECGQEIDRACQIVAVQEIDWACQVVVLGGVQGRRGVVLRRRRRQKVGREAAAVRGRARRVLVRVRVERAGAVHAAGGRRRGRPTSECENENR